VSISIDILKTMSVVIVRQGDYIERWKHWLNRICDGSGERTRSLSWQGRKVNNREFLGNYRTMWSVPHDLTLRSFSANYWWHQQIIWTLNNGK